MLEKLKDWLVCEEKSQGRQEMSERVGESCPARCCCLGLTRTVQSMVTATGSFNWWF